jgi:hypothetical protein
MFAVLVLDLRMAEAVIRVLKQATSKSLHRECSGVKERFIKNKKDFSDLRSFLEGDAGCGRAEKGHGAISLSDRRSARSGCVTRWAQRAPGVIYVDLSIIL